MEITVAMRAHRALRRLSRYRTLSEQGLPSDFAQSVGVCPDEVLVGFYENTLNASDFGVLITSQGFHVHRGSFWEFLPFKDMAAVGLEGGEKSIEVDNIAVQMHNGKEKLVPFIGGNPEWGTRDTFAAWTFLGNVLGDFLRRQKAN